MGKQKRKARRGRTALRPDFISVATVLLCTLMLAGLGIYKLIQPALPGSVSDPASSQTPAPSQEESLPPIVLERADVDKDVGRKVLLELLGTQAHEGQTPDLTGSAPRILIYHTHTTEAFFPTKQYPYEATSPWRTADNTRNIVAVGDRLAETLQKEYGIAVLHDITNHEPPKLNTAYNRSLATMLKYKEDYPSLTMYIDLHRDSYSNNPGEIKDYVIIDGKEVARIMFVVGTGEGATGTGFDEMPDFASNYALAEKLTEYLAAIDPGLVRNIRVKTGRYNQHVSDHCLLAEIGHNANSFEQALNAADLLAKAIAAVSGLSPAAPSPRPTPTVDPVLQWEP